MWVRVGLVRSGGVMGMGARAACECERCRPGQWNCQGRGKLVRSVWHGIAAYSSDNMVVA